LFTYGPFYHFGVRTSAPVTSKWTLGAQLVQGWNVVQDNNSGKTFGITSVNTLGKLTLANNYYAGPENTNTTTGWRNFYDLVASMALTDKLSAYLSWDIGRNNSPTGTGHSTFTGVGGAMKYQITNHFAVSPRFEWYNDADGFMTGTAQQLKEFTITGEAKINDSFISRFEYRKDWSNQPYFQHSPNVPAMYKDQQLFIASFIVVAKPGMFGFMKSKP
jgi:hypothetical protein